MTDSTYLDDNTGELIDSSPLSIPKEKRKRRKKFYVGEDTSFPRQCVSEEELYEIAKDMDSFHWRELEINHWALVESLRQNILTPTEISIIVSLSEKVISWNVCFCSLDDFPCHEKAVHKFLKSLQPWSLRVLENKQGRMKIEISPFLVWKGDKLRREKCIKEWYENKASREL